MEKIHFRLSTFLLFTTLLLVTFQVSLVHSLYGSRSDVIELTPSNFETRVMDSNDVWIVEFFAPWCGHCKNLVGEYSKAASALKGIVKMGAVNADEHQSLGAKYGVQGFPTIKIFGLKKSSPVEYSGARNAQGFIEAGFKELRKIVDSRTGGGGSSYSQSSSGGSGGKGSGGKDVIELTDSNFKSTVLDSNDLWLVEFYAPWCGHCKNLAPVWADVASELKGKVKVGALDATVHTVTANQYSIKGFPTIKVFQAGSAEEYNGGRSKSDFVTFALDKLSELAPVPDIIELTSDKVLNDVCENTQLCVISFLPHILDCDSKCRNDYLSTLKKIAEKFKKNRWGYLWAEAVTQPELEESLGIGGFGYPAMAAVNVRKMKYSWLRGSFGLDGIGEFLRDLSYGKGSSVSVKGAKLPKVHSTDPWDGKDGVPPAMEDYSDTDHSEL